MTPTPAAPPFSTVLAEVLGHVFASYGLPVEAAAPGPDPSGPIAAVGFEGPRSGLLQLCLDSDAASAMATTLLGGFPPENEVERNDALGEWANIVAGNFKTRALDPTGTYRLGLPVVGGDGPRGDSPGTRLRFRVGDGGELAVKLVVDEWE